MEFYHERIDNDPPCGRLGFCLTTDFTGNGRPDVLVGGMGSEVPVEVFGKEYKLRHLPVVGDVIKQREWNVFWYENPGWERHDVVKAPDLCIGASLADLTGNGREDLVIGENLGSQLFWFEQPADPRTEWEKHLITDDFVKYHDTTVADVDDDGDPELVVLSQRSETVFYYDIPEDPYQSPWPTENRHIVAENCNVEGVVVTDIDGDGRTELLAGPNVFRRSEDGAWDRERIATDWEWTRLAVADLDGDGTREVVMTEGDQPYHGGKPGRLGVFDPPEWECTLLADDLYCPHSLEIADFDDNGHPDIYVAEMGLWGDDEPRHFIYRNDGNGGFDPQVISRGIPTHEAKVLDVDGDDRLDIVGKSYTPEHHVDLWRRTD